MKQKIQQAIIDNLEAQASASTASFASHSPDEIGYDGSINVKNLAEAVMLMISRVEESQKEPPRLSALTLEEATALLDEIKTNPVQHAIDGWQSGFEAGSRDAVSRINCRPGDGDMGG